MAFTSQHAHTCPTRLRMGIHEVETALDSWFIDHRIGIKQQHVFGIRATDGLIVGTCKTYILSLRRGTSSLA